MRPRDDGANTRSTTLHTAVAKAGGQDVRVRLLNAGYSTFRVDVRTYHGPSPGTGLNVSVRHLPAIVAAMREAEEEAERLGLLRDEAA